jgi:hypothetical protein
MNKTTIDTVTDKLRKLTDDELELVDKFVCQLEKKFKHKMEVKSNEDS